MPNEPTLSTDGDEWKSPLKTFADRLNEDPALRELIRVSTAGDAWKPRYFYPGVRRIEPRPHQVMECENCGHRMRQCDIEEELTQKGRTNCRNEDAVEEIHEEVCPKCKEHSSFVIYDGEEEDE